MTSPARALRPPTQRELDRADEVVGAVLRPTPLIEATVAGTRLWLKLESLQPTGSFKVRGAIAALDHLASTQPGRSVVTCSAGNHGLGVAFAASRLGVEATVVVPATASRVKRAKLGAYDVELIEVGDTYEEAEAAALELADARDALYVSPYNDAFVIAGQSTMTAEIMAQLPTATDLIVSVGGGGLLSGSIVRAAGSALRVHGALVEQNAAFASAVRGDVVDESLLRPTIADGLAGGIEAGSVTVDIAVRAGVDLHLVSEAATRAALRASVVDVGLVIEGSAAVALAVGLAQAPSMGPEIVVALSGRNITPDLVADVMAG